MTRRERTIRAITHHETDTVPYQIDLTLPALERLLAYVGDPNYVDGIGNHMTGTGYGSDEETFPGSGYFRDQFGVVWNRSGADKDIGIVDNLCIPEPSIDCYSFPVIDELALRRQCEAALKDAGDRYTSFGIGFSMFERAWTLRGMENLLADMLVEPDFVHSLLDAICEHNLRVLDIALDYPFDGIYFGDDWGQQSGTIMGPNHWRTFIKPRVARMYAKAKESGKLVAQHSCGDILEIFPDLIEIGLDVYNTFQPEIYDVKGVKKEFGKDLAFWGGISTQRVLPYVTPEEVKRVAREMMSIMGVGGGYIAAPTHAVPADVPPQNLVALVEAFQGQAQ